jgi:hypothetical protein
VRLNLPQHVRTRLVDSVEDSDARRWPRLRQDTHIVRKVVVGLTDFAASAPRTRICVPCQQILNQIAHFDIIECIPDAIANNAYIVPFDLSCTCLWRQQWLKPLHHAVEDVLLPPAILTLPSLRTHFSMIFTYVMLNTLPEGVQIMYHSWHTCPVYATPGHIYDRDQ